MPPAIIIFLWCLYLGFTRSTIKGEDNFSFDQIKSDKISVAAISYIENDTIIGSRLDINAVYKPTKDKTKKLSLSGI